MTRMSNGGLSHSRSKSFCLIGARVVIARQARLAKGQNKKL